MAWKNAILPLTDKRIFRRSKFMHASWDTQYCSIFRLSDGICFQIVARSTNKCKFFFYIGNYLKLIKRDLKAIERRKTLVYLFEPTTFYSDNVANLETIDSNNTKKRVLQFN